MRGMEDFVTKLAELLADLNSIHKNTDNHKNRIKLSWEK